VGLCFDSIMDEIAKRPKDSKLYLKMGKHLLFRGHFSESLGFLKKAGKLGDESFDLDFILGKVYLFLSCSEKSIYHFKKALDKIPNHKEVQYIIDTLIEERHFKIESLSVSTVKELFDSYADHFENHLLNKLHYKTPKKLVKFFLEKVEKKEGPLSVLDLGCGTGLFASELERELKNCLLVGVDLSIKMLKEAEKKDLYLKLYEDDLFNYLEKEEKQNTIFDLVVACDTVPYLGNLEGFFKKSCGVIGSESLLLFSFEVLEGLEKDWLFSSNGRFKHSFDYVLSLAKKNNLRGELRFETLREEKGERVKGCFFLGRSIKMNEMAKSS